MMPVVEIDLTTKLNLQAVALLVRQQNEQNMILWK